MSPSPDQTLIPIDLRAGDPAAEIFLIDRKLQLVKQGVGVLQAEVPSGLYEVKLRTGTSTFEEVISVRAPVRKTYPALEFSSPVPLDHTHKSHEFHVENAVKHSTHTHVALGAGSHIFLFARDWTSKKPPAGASAPGTYPNPAKGLSLRDASGGVLVDFEQTGAVGTNWDPWAACNIGVAPGSYLLHLDAPDGTVWERTLVASPGWQTQCFLLQRMFGEDKAADIGGATILMREDGAGFKPDSHQARMSELARLGLVNQRPVLSREMQDLLGDKFENPMLGIFGAHLLLQSEEQARGPYDRSLFSHVVKMLRSLLKAPHPDVEALAWKAGQGDRSFHYLLPPMLRRSWPIVTHASAEWPEVIPPNSVSAGICDSILAEQAWLVWSAEQREADSQEIVETLALYVGAANAAEPAPELELAAAAAGGEAPSGDFPPVMASPMPPRGDTERVIRKLTEQLSIPRNLVEKYLSAAQSRATEIRQDYTRRASRRRGTPSDIKKE